LSLLKKGWENMLKWQWNLLILILAMGYMGIPKEIDGA
jgi:hypothetical protein